MSIQFSVLFHFYERVFVHNFVMCFLSKNSHVRFHFLQRSMYKEPEESKVCIYYVICLVFFG